MEASFTGEFLVLCLLKDTEELSKLVLGSALNKEKNGIMEQVVAEFWTPSLCSASEDKESSTEF